MIGHRLSGIGITDLKKKKNYDSGAKTYYGALLVTPLLCTE